MGEQAYFARKMADGLTVNVSSSVELEGALESELSLDLPMGKEQADGE